MTVTIESAKALIKALRVKELHTCCAQLGLSKGGLKVELQLRLAAYFDAALPATGTRFGSSTPRENREQWKLEAAGVQNQLSILTRSSLRQDYPYYVSGVSMRVIPKGLLSAERLGYTVLFSLFVAPQKCCGWPCSSSNHDRVQQNAWHPYAFQWSLQPVLWSGPGCNRRLVRASRQLTK